MRNLERKRTLLLMNRSKNLRKRLDIDIRDYDDYYKKYSSIIIELIMSKNVKELDFKYLPEYDGYLKMEKKNNSIMLKITSGINFLYQLFSVNSCDIEGVIFHQMMRNNINDMHGMFMNYTNIKFIDFRSFNSENFKTCMIYFSFVGILSGLIILKILILIM